MSSSASSNEGWWKYLVGRDSRVKDVVTSLEDGIVELSSSATSNNTDEMIEQQMSTSSSSIPKSFKYDVFLSFRGEDTRKSFVDHLYHALQDKGILTFKDDEKIEQRERINDQLFKSIEDSKFYIIVFSKNYASASLCLDELVKIMQCQKMTEHTAFPVFYDVEPTEVRKQTGAVKEAFAEHEKKENAGKWREAMKELADLPGWELKATANGDESKLIQIIVDKMSLELNYGFHANSVGMVTQAKDVVTPATYFYQFITMLLPVLNKLVEVEVDLTPGSAFSFIITCLLAFAGLKSQSVVGFPFKTHPNAIKVPVASLLIYAFASMAEHVVSVARLDRTVYAIIARLGHISSLCLFVTSLAILIYI